MSVDSMPRSYEGTASLVVGEQDRVESLDVDLYLADGQLPGHQPTPTWMHIPYPSNAIEAVAPENTHFAHVKRQRIEAHHKLSYRIGAAAVIMGATVGIAVGAFRYDQDTLAPIIWGNESTSFYLMAENNYRVPLRLEATDKTVNDIPDFEAKPTMLFTPPPATVVLIPGGLGINDAGPGVAAPQIPSLSEGIPNSRMYAMKAGTRMNMPGVFRAVDKVMIESDPDEVILDGMSTGCKTMLYMGAYIRQYWPDKYLKLGICDSGPLDAYSTYELRRDPSKITMGETSAKLALFGGPALASVVDILSDDTKRKYMSPEGGIDWDKFVEETERVERDKWNKLAASNELRVGQLAIIVDDSAASNMEIIAETPEGMPPMTFAYLAPKNDNTVDGAYASLGYRDLAIANHMTNIIIPLDSEHAGARAYPEVYNQAISKLLEQTNHDAALWRKMKAQESKFSHHSDRPGGI